MTPKSPQERSAHAALVSRFTAFPPLARRVLLTLCEHGALTAEQLANHAGAASLGHAKALREAGLVEHVSGEHAPRFVLSREGAKLADAYNAAAAGSSEGGA